MARPRCQGRTKGSPSRLRFRPPRPTGLPPRGLRPSSYNRSVVVSTYSRSVLGARGKLLGRPGQFKTIGHNFVAICERSSAGRDPHRVLAPGVRPAVEPAVARLDAQPAFGE